MKKRIAVFTALAIAACSSETPSAGVLVVITSPDVYMGTDYDSLRITAFTKSETKTGKDIKFPTSIGISGAPKGPLKIEVRAIKDGVVRLAATALTTAPSEGSVIVPITFSAACRDRCVQVGVDEPLTSYCDSKTLECVPEKTFSVPVDKLKPYDGKSDATAGLKQVDCGGNTIVGDQTCNGNDFGLADCTTVTGEGATGDLACFGCRGITSQSCTNPNGLEPDAAWPMPGRTYLRQGRADRTGPRTAPAALKPVVPDSVGAPFSPPVISADGTVWLTSSFYSLPAAPKSANFAGTVVSIVNGSVNVFQPDPVFDCRLDLQSEAQGSRGCRWSLPILADDGAMWTMTNTGEGYRFTSASPIKGDRVLSIFDALGASCKGQSFCNVTQLGGIVRKVNGVRYAYVPTGAGLFVFKADNSGTFALQNNVAECPSWQNRVPAIGRDGTIYISLEFAFPNPKPHDAVCAVSSNGAFKWRSPDAAGLTAAPVIGPDDTVYFGSLDHRLYALDPKKPSAFKWSYATGGPTTSPAFGPDGTMYFGSADENLYALEASTQSLKWTVRVKGAITATPVIDSEGTSYFGTSAGYFYAINPNGTVRFRTFVSSPIVETAAMDAKGAIWFGSNDGFVFTIPAN